MDTIQENNQGIIITTKYLAPRKRKEINYSMSEETFEKAFQLLKDFRQKNGGKFISAHKRPCERKKMKVDNEIIIMTTVDYFFAPKESLTENQIQELNS